MPGPYGAADPPRHAAGRRRPARTRRAAAAGAWIAARVGHPEAGGLLPGVAGAPRWRRATGTIVSLAFAGLAVAVIAA